MLFHSLMSGMMDIGKASDVGHAVYGGSKGDKSVFKTVAASAISKGYIPAFNILKESARCFDSKTY